MTELHLIRLERERDAKLCKEIADRVDMEPTVENITKAERVTEWFEGKHHCGWRKYVRKGVEL